MDEIRSILADYLPEGEHDLRRYAEGRTAVFAVAPRPLAVGAARSRDAISPYRFFAIRGFGGATAAAADFAN
jgi:hypothetical protein